MLNYHWHMSIHRSKQEGNTHVLLLLIKWLHTRGGWSRFLRNVQFIIARHIQCMVFADSGLTWVAWMYFAAHGKRALIRIRDQPPLSTLYLEKNPPLILHTHLSQGLSLFSNPVPESSILLSLVSLRWRWQWRNSFWDPFLSQKFVSFVLGVEGEYHLHLVV